MLHIILIKYIIIFNKIIWQINIDKDRIMYYHNNEQQFD